MFCQAADRGGLTATSQSRFVSVYMRYYNRLSNGSGITAMRKIPALLDAGVLDVEVGPTPAVDWDGQRLRVRGLVTGVVKDLYVLVDGKLQRFDPEHDAHALYPNLLRRGLIRKWRNPGQPPEQDFVPGALDLTPDFHPVREDGGVDTRLTVLGTPAEGLWFFQHSAARPRANSYVLNNVARWATTLVSSLAADQGHMTAGREAERG